MGREFQNYVTRIFPALVMAVIACSVMLGQDVRTNYMPGTDFSKYRTYKWVAVEGGPHPDQMVDAQIKQSIDSQLASKGFTKTDSDTLGISGQP